MSLYIPVIVSAYSFPMYFPPAILARSLCLVFYNTDLWSNGFRTVGIAPARNFKFQIFVYFTVPDREQCYRGDLEADQPRFLNFNDVCTFVR